MTFILKLLAPFLTPILIVAGISAGVLGMSLYDSWIDDPAVARAARTEYVHKSEKWALEAQLEQERKLRAGAQLAVLDYANKLEVVNRLRMTEDENTQQENADYEAELKDAGRHRGLTDADIEWVRRP